KGVAVLIGIVALFFAGAPIEIVALGGAALLLLGRVRPERLYAQIDWNLLVMFAGLFVVISGFERHVVTGWNLQRLASAQSAPIAPLAALAAVISNLVSNSPAVLLLKSVVTSLGTVAHEPGWLALAMASRLSDNLTPI